MVTPDPWWVKVLKAIGEYLMNQKITQRLGEAGASPAQLDHSLSLSLPLESGYMTPQPPANVLESRELDHLHPELKKRYLALASDFEAETGRQLFPTCTWRSVARQQTLYAQGRTAPGAKVTQLDGVTKRSRHNVFPSEAIDVCVDADPGPGKHPVWDETSYAPLGPLALKHGLIWGGSWSGFKDYPHLELPAAAA